MKVAVWLLFLMPVVTWGQKEKSYKFKPRQHVAPASLVFLAGAVDGLNQVVSHQYPKFKRVFPNANDYYWSPSVSFTNKYKNRDPAQGEKYWGSTSLLVFTTDAYHLTRFTEHLLLSGALTVKITQEKKKWYWYIVEMAGYWVVNRVGFALVYNSF